MSERTYTVVPSDPDGFVIIDLDCDCEVVDEDGEIMDDDAPGHCYASEREAEEAILRWERREADRRTYREMAWWMHKRAADETDPGCRALIDIMFPEPRG